MCGLRTAAIFATAELPSAGEAYRLAAPGYLVAGRVLFLTPNQQCQSTEARTSLETTGIYHT